MRKVTEDFIVVFLSTERGQILLLLLAVIVIIQDGVRTLVPVAVKIPSSN